MEQGNFLFFIHPVMVIVRKRLTSWLGPYTKYGLKTVEALNGQYADPVIIEPKLNSFEEIYSNRVSTA